MEIKTNNLKGLAGFVEKELEFIRATRCGSPGRNKALV